MMQRLACVAMVGVGFVLVSVSESWAQQPSDQPSLAVENNSSGSAVRGRAPGRMVSDGVDRAQAAKNRLMTRPDITRTPGSEPITPVLQARIEALQTLFTVIQQMIVAFHNAILVQGGRNPIVVPPPNFPSIPTPPAPTPPPSNGGGGINLPPGVNINDFLNPGSGGS